MIRLLKNDRGWPLRTYELLPMFGLKPSSPIPPDFEAQQRIQGIEVKISRKQGRGKKHRVHAACPACGCWFSAGNRINQHYRVCKQRDNTGE